VPELPDVAVYVEALTARIAGARLHGIEVRGPSLLRSVEPPLGAVEGRHVEGVRRLGKRVVLALEGELFLVLHLMIAGRLHWRPPDARTGGRSTLAVLRFPDALLTLTEAGSKRRATLHLEQGEAALARHDPGGLEPLHADPDAFRAALVRERHTLKRALTDPRILSGIGNAYSDEILHRARLSPFRLTTQLDAQELARLHAATRTVLEEWTARLRRQAGGAFPERVTAFREGMAVHGRHRQPCPDCGAPVQRVVYAANECNYCARCQTAGRLLADRALSRLLRSDWPRTLDELEARRPGAAAAPPGAAPGPKGGGRG